MNQVEVLDLLRTHGAILSGHFLLSSGRHSDTYVQKQAVLEHPRVTMSLAHAIAARFEGTGFTCVLSPALGAIALGFSVAHSADVRFVFAERAGGALQLRRGQHIAPEDKVLVVEDVITTGGSAAETVALAHAAHATVVGVGAIVDRSNVTPAFHLEALARVEARDYASEECPACARGEPLESPGSRHTPLP